MRKIVITLPNEVLAKARRESRRTRVSLSAYIARSIEMRVVDEDLQKMLDEMLAETGGPLTEEERREADKALGFKPRRTKKRARRLSTSLR